MTTPRLAAVLLGLSFLALGCSGDGGGGGGSDTQPRSANPAAVITEGTYVITDADIHSDGCQLGYTASDFNGGTEFVTVASGGLITIGSTDVTLANGVITGDDTPVNTSPIANCTVDVTQSEEGTVPENDVMEVVQNTHAENPVGDGCDDIPVSLPCDTAYFIKFTKQ